MKGDRAKVRAAAAVCGTMGIRFHRMQPTLGRCVISNARLAILAQEECPVNTQNPIQLILGYIQSLFGEVGIGWFEGLQALIINLIDALFG